MDDDSDSEADSTSGLRVYNLKSEAWLYAQKHIAVLFIVFFKGGNVRICDREMTGM